MVAALLHSGRLCSYRLSKDALSSFGRHHLLGYAQVPSYAPGVGFANQARSAFRRATAGARRKTLKETLMEPSQGTAITVGQGALMGASGFGLGCLCYYGLGLSSKPGAIEHSLVWPEYVRNRIKTTYTYFGGSIVLTALSAVACSRSPAFIRMISKNSLLVLGGSIAAVVGSGMVVRSIPYSEGLGAKQLAWAAHCGIIGAVIAPICFLGGPIVTRAAWYTAGVVGGLSALAACAPSEKFLYMGGPLACGLGLVFVSSLGSAFLPPTTALGAGLYSLSMYGGLIVFGGLLLYDTQRIVRMAETHPLYAVRPFDPVNASVSIYLDTINIFIRIAMLLAGGGGSRRK